MASHCFPPAKPAETRGRPRRLHPTEVIAITIAFHQSGYETFKHFYQKQVCAYWRDYFPNIVSYSRFVQRKQEVLPLLTDYLQSYFGECSGISFVDSTRLAVCHNRRIATHRVFAALAERGKTSLGWFYGFKLHLVINHKGDLLGVWLTPGNIDDRKPIPYLAAALHGSLYGDKGYISKDLRARLQQTGVDYVYIVRKNMDPLPLSAADEVFLKKRVISESVIKELKTQTMITPGTEVLTTFR